MQPLRSLPRPPEAVLFDMDGVVVDTFDAWVAVLADCRRRRGLPILSAQAVRDCWGQGLMADCETLFPGADPIALAREYDEGFLRHLDGVAPEPGAVETICAIAAAGVRVALVTNSPVALARRILDRVRLRDAFDEIAGGDEVPRGKPDPGLIELALRRLGAEPGRCVLVGDTALDIEASRAAGVPAIGYRIDGGDARIDALPALLPLLGID